MASLTAPGTVSKLLWHFTGGPNWNERRQRQNHRPKSPELAYEALLSILKTRELRLGNYAETARVELPSRPRFDPSGKATETQQNSIITVRSAPICCLADIPIPHLAYHSNRYGKFAIAFHRDAVVDQGFNPVLYTLQDTGVIRSLYTGLNGANATDLATISSSAGEIESLADDVSEDAGSEIASAAQLIDLEADAVEDSIEHARSSFRQLLAFIKTFSRSEFQTVYCEREWRSLRPFKFRYEDVAMVVLPKAIGDRKYFDRLLRSRVFTSHQIPRSLPLVPWDDLVEH